MALLDLPALDAVLIPLEVQWCGCCKRVLAPEEFQPSHRGMNGHWCRRCKKSDNPPRKKFRPRKCKSCGNAFTPDHARRIYCNKRCRFDAVNAKNYAARMELRPEPRFCAREGCGVDITDRRSDAKWCSSKCSKAVRMTPEAQRKYALWAKYKMTLDDYDRMVESQGGMCFLCDADDPQTPHGFWHVDHNHATGVVRKLLCSPCNLALGLFRDSPEVLRRAADYVESEGL